MPKTRASDPSRSPPDAAAQFDAIVQLPFGFVGIRTAGDLIQEILFLSDSVQCKAASTASAQRAVDQLIAYCASGAAIDMPLAISGTEFQQRVWRAIRRIPRGETRSYGAIARQLDSAARAVGQACGDNRLPLAIPCHRVVSASGIGGFAHHRGGSYERIKRWLLLHEACDGFSLSEPA